MLSLRLISVAPLLLLLFGCTSRRTELEPPVSPPAAFSDAGEVPAPEDWWKSLGDPRLDLLIAEAMSENLDLAAAWERLQASEALARRAAADRWPALDGFAEGAYEEPEAPNREGFSLGLSAAYELDLWGRIDSRAEAEAFRAQASRFDYRTAAVTLSAEVARTWYELVEAHQQVALLGAQVEANAQVEQLLEHRFESGQTRAVDWLRQRQLTEATREQRIIVQTQAGLLRHRLAVLLGEPPPAAGLQAATADLPPLSPLPRTGLPVALVQRRPDLQRAWFELAAADADLAAAIADRYPRLSFSATLASSGEQADDLFGTWTRSFGGSLLAPLFRGGALRAEVERAEAIRRAQVFAYGQATLRAFREVEDALLRERQQRLRIASLERQLDLLTQALDQLRAAYFNGQADYIDVLSALTQSQAVRRDLLTARRVLLQARIALHRALAGGFATPREGASNPNPATP